MNLDEMLRTYYADLPEDLDAEQRIRSELRAAEVEHAGASTTTRKRWSRRASFVVATAAAVAAIAVAAAVVGVQRSTTPSGSSSSPFRLQLTLPGTSFPANGTTIHGYVTAINHTGHPIVIHEAQCDGWLQAGLSGPHVHFGISSSDVACADGQLRNGTSRLPISIATTYTSCQQGSRPGTADTPHCLGPRDSIVPPLPPGSYLVHVGTQNLASTPALPRPIRITLTPPNQAPGHVPAWARRCVPPSFGSPITTYDGLTYLQATRAARRDGYRLDVLCTDGSEDIGQPSHTAGQRWISAAMENGRIIYARQPG